MAVGIPLVVGFTKSDEIRVDTCLKKLIPHLKKDQFVKTVPRCQVDDAGSRYGEG